ncbi:single-stranded DNA-binding protein [Rhodospirillaceae bacterium SYSU D60014]|uniref:single-stranded DNA-binding protein n=1 Tax=Virgifigura deserti TaxID=2268457 RepID=UPI000E66FAD0
MYQRFIGVGRLGRDPEVSTIPSGTKLATLRLATSEYVKGEERTEWHRVVVWDEKLIEVLERRARKGTLLAVEGQVRTRKWQKEGRDILSTEIVLDRFNSRLQILAGAKTEADAEDSADETAGRAPTQAYGTELELEDELPF